MKPTWTSISREGLKLLSISLDTIGLYGRSADDLDLFCEIFQLKDDEPVVTKPITEMRIAVCKTPVWDDAIVEESMKKVWVEAQEALKAAGATLVELELPKDFEKVLPATYRTMHSEARTAFLGDYLKTPDLLRDEHKSRVENRQGTSRKQQCADYDLLGAMRPIFDNIAAEYDVSRTFMSQKFQLLIEASLFRLSWLQLCPGKLGLVRRKLVTVSKEFVALPYVSEVADDESVCSPTLRYVDRSAQPLNQRPRLRWRGERDLVDTWYIFAAYAMIFFTARYADRSNAYFWTIHRSKTMYGRQRGRKGFQGIEEWERYE